MHFEASLFWSFKSQIGRLFCIVSYLVSTRNYALLPTILFILYLLGGYLVICYLLLWESHGVVESLAY